MVITMTTKRKKAAKAMNIKSKYFFLSILAKGVYSFSSDILFWPLKIIGKIALTHNNITYQRLRSNQGKMWRLEMLNLNFLVSFKRFRISEIWMIFDSCLTGSKNEIFFRKPASLGMSRVKMNSYVTLDIPNDSGYLSLKR